MISRIGRVAALLAVGATFAVAAPAQAHHIPTCTGFNNPQCNVNYFYAHQVQPTAQPAINAVNGAITQAGYLAAYVDWCSRNAETCANYEVNNLYWFLETNVLGPYVRPITDPVVAEAFDLAWEAVDLTFAVKDQVERDVYYVGCFYFGAC